MRAALVVFTLSLVAAWETSADASCMSQTYFAPSSGSRIPPGATIYVFPDVDDNVVVRVVGDGREIYTFNNAVEAGRNRAIAVRLEDEPLHSVTVEATRVGSHGERELGSATYTIDPSVAEPASSLEITAIERSKSEGVPACVSHDLLYFEPDVRAPAYRFEWARSEQAYRDGDRHVAIVKRNEHIDGNVFSVGNSGCGQDVIPMLWRETVLYVGVTPVGYEEWWRYRTPQEPIRIDLGALANRSWNDLYGDRFVDGREPPRPEPAELEPAELEAVEVAETPWLHLGLGALLGLLAGWPLGLLIGRRIFKTSRAGASRA